MRPMKRCASSTSPTRFCTPDKCPVVMAGGVIAYRDRLHLTQTFSASLASAVASRLALFLPPPSAAR